MSTGYDLLDLGGIDTWSADEKRFVDKDIPTRYIGTSANVLEPGGQSPFWHSHAQMEEQYVFLAGNGQMALDDEVVDVQPGSVVVVHPGVMRAWRCLPDSAQPLRWLCIRAGGGALSEVGHDGELDRDRPMPWA